MDVNLVPKTIRRLQTAEGYLELNLPERALAELNAIQDQGPFEAAIALLEGEALEDSRAVRRRGAGATQAGRHDDSVAPQQAGLAIDVRMLPDVGREELAEIAEMVVQAEEAPVEKPKVIRVAFVSLPMLPEALKELFSELTNQANQK